jgi:nitrous oxide reductase
MSRKPKSLKSSRREFLKGAAVVSGAATLAVVAGGSAAKVDVPETKPTDAAPAGSKGYHVTPHIRTYYDLARR